MIAIFCLAWAHSSNATFRKWKNPASWLYSPPPWTFWKLWECKLFKNKHFLLVTRKLLDNFHVMRSYWDLLDMKSINHFFSIERMTPYLQCDIPCAVYNMLICLLNHGICLEKYTAAYLVCPPVAPSGAACTQILMTSFCKTRSQWNPRSSDKHTVGYGCPLRNDKHTHTAQKKLGAKFYCDAG